MDWTVIIAAFIGFGGVIFTQYKNAQAARCMQEKQWGYENTRRADEQKCERISLRSALLAELRLAYRAIDEPVKNLESLNEYPSHNAGFRVSIPDTIYKANCSRIGLLPEKEVAGVVDAYTMLRDRSDFLRLVYNPVTGFNGAVIVPPEKREEEIESEKADEAH